MKFNFSEKYNSGKKYNSASYIVIERFDSFHLSDVSDVETIGVVHGDEDPIGFSDSYGTFVTDFVVATRAPIDTSIDWFSPLSMKVDWANTSLQVMPTSESDYIDISTLDGSMVQNTVYKNRAFNFVLFSEDGLSESQKDDLKQKIVKVLDSTKGSFKHLVIPPSEHYFDVKYSGSASIQQGPSFVKATLPFEVKPYSHPMFTDPVKGAGTIVNNGMKKCGIRIEISGPVTNPVVDISKSTGETYSFRWTGEVAQGTTLVINGEELTCFTIDSDGNKENAITKLEKDIFAELEPGESAEITPDSTTSSHVVCKINESFIW